jgi:hypothetical protein
VVKDTSQLKATLVTGTTLILGTLGKHYEVHRAMNAADIIQERPCQGGRSCEQECDRRR